MASQRDNKNIDKMGFPDYRIDLSTVYLFLILDNPNKQNIL